MVRITNTQLLRLSNIMRSSSSRFSSHVQVADCLRLKDDGWKGGPFEGRREDQLRGQERFAILQRGYTFCDLWRGELCLDVYNIYIIYNLF